MRINVGKPNADIIETDFGGCLAVGNNADADLALQGVGGYDLVVYAAKEVRPLPQVFADRFGRRRPIAVHYIPLLDTLFLTPSEQFSLQLTIPRIASAFKKGKRVLVTCNMGINRCAFVAGLVLHAVYPMSGAEALQRVRVRRARGTPLQNGYYAKMLAEKPPRRHLERFRESFL